MTTATHIKYCFGPKLERTSTIYRRQPFCIAKRTEIKALVNLRRKSKQTGKKVTQAQASPADNNTKRLMLKCKKRIKQRLKAFLDGLLFFYPAPARHKIQSDRPMKHHQHIVLTHLVGTVCGCGSSSCARSFLFIY